jgi:protein phosphatase 2C family protein 2/3
MGPIRVLPGRLSVSRTFGDIEAKNESLGGNSKVVVCLPEIQSFKLKETFDFVVMGSKT